MISTTLSRLWRDQAGSVLATEYLLLGSVVVLGGAAGLGEMRDSMNAELREYGTAVREVRQQYSYPAARGVQVMKAGDKAGTVVTTDSASMFAAP